MERSIKMRILERISNQKKLPWNTVLIFLQSCYFKYHGYSSQYGCEFALVPKIGCDSIMMLL